MAEYKGKEVKLDDPFRLPQGSDKKFGVYVKNPKSGNVIMVKLRTFSMVMIHSETTLSTKPDTKAPQKTDKTSAAVTIVKHLTKRINQSQNYSKKAMVKMVTGIPRTLLTVTTQRVFARNTLQQGKKEKRRSL